MQRMQGESRRLSLRKRENNERIFPMYALTGANGHLGRLVLKHLLTYVPADQIIATTRKPEQLADLAAQGIVVRRADFADPATLSAAFVGVKRLLIISTDVLGEQRVKLHKAAIEAAASAGVNHIVYTSGPDANPNASHPIPAEHGQTEAALAASGVEWTALRNSFYSDFLKDFIGLLYVNGEVLLPEGSARHSWVTREDCARAAAGTLAGNITDVGPVDVTGPEALSFADVVHRYSSISGQSVGIKVLPEQEILARVVAKGVPQEAANFVVGFVAWTAREVPTKPTDTVKRASGTEPSSVDEILRSLSLA
jgi:NAD(P)H dehydrogenase (quinone)